MSDLTLSQEEIDSLLTGSISHKARKTEVLTQQEIDSLLTPIYGGEPPELVSPKGKFQPEKFRELLKDWSLEPEPPVGMFTKNTITISFRKPGGEELLADMVALNEKDGSGHRKVPGTDLMLINYSQCPQCRKLYSWKDLRDYYRNPSPSPEFPNRAHQLVADTRVVCSGCGQAFLPALVIADSLPRNEGQFLCRLQTIHAVEDWFAQVHKVPVLSRRTENLRSFAGRQEILNDLDIALLSPRPGLILNILQYSTPPAQINFMEGRNREAGDPIYGRIADAGRSAPRQEV